MGVFCAVRGGEFGFLRRGERVDRFRISGRPRSWRGSWRTEMAKAKPFDAAEYLDSPEMIAAYINEALESQDPSAIAVAIGTVARARGMSAVAEQAGLSRRISIGRWAGKRAGIRHGHQGASRARHRSGCATSGLEGGVVRTTFRLFPDDELCIPDYADAADFLKLRRHDTATILRREPVVLREDREVAAVAGDVGAIGDERMAIAHVLLSTFSSPTPMPRRATT